MKRRKLLWAAGITTAVLGLATILHIPIMRSLGAGCPFQSQGTKTAAEQDEVRKASTARLRGQTPAPTRPALHFVLGQTTRTDVENWVSRAGGTCQPALDKLGMACENVASGDALGALHADFDASGALVALSFVSREAKADDATRTLRQLRSRLSPTVGEPSKTAGESTVAYLAGGPLRQSRSEYRHADYYASVTATNMGPRGYVISQVYRAVD